MCDKIETVIVAEMIDAIKVQFLKPIFEDDFPERGMKAWLTNIEWHEKNQCYHLFFDFTEFEAENDKYLRETYYSNIHTKDLPQKELYTAKEAGWYNNKYSVYFSASNDDRRDDAMFMIEIKKFLRVIE